MGDAGFGVVSRWAIERIETTNELAVYVALTLHADAEGLCWPSHTTLARESKLAVSSVKKALDSLAAKGLVCWEARIRDGRTRLTNAYTVTLGPPAATRLTPSRDTATPQPTGGYKHTTEQTNEQSPLPPEQPDALPLAGLPESAATTHRKVARKSVETTGFAEFYDTYPRHMKRQDAAKAYSEAIIGGATAEDILAGLRSALPVLADANARGFCPYPSSWLRDRRWLDRSRPKPVQAGGIPPQERAPWDT